MEASRGIRRLRVAIQQADLDDLRQRLARTRLPDEVAGSGWEYGTNLSYMKELLEYWRTYYDWRKQEQELNRFDHYEALVDGLKIHFIHQRGRGPNPKPLLLLHGWPGSVYEFMALIPMLTEPNAYGGDERDAFTVVAPSLPGYGFSERPRTPGMNVRRIAELMFKLMTEVLGYKRFAIQGGDWGAFIGSCIAKLHPDEVLGLHLNMVGAIPAEGRNVKPLNDEEQEFLRQAEQFRRFEAGYQWIQGTKPQTLAYALNDSPVGLAAWIVEKFRAWSDCSGDVERCFSKDQLLTNISIYWFTETINSSIRLYYEERRRPWRLEVGERIEVATGFAAFPKEILRPPRSWVERLYNLKRWSVMSAGGHFAAMEQPRALAGEIQAFFRDIA